MYIHCGILFITAAISAFFACILAIEDVKTKNKHLTCGLLFALAAASIGWLTFAAATPDTVASEISFPVSSITFPDGTSCQVVYLATKNPSFRTGFVNCNDLFGKTLPEGTRVLFVTPEVVYHGVSFSQFHCRPYFVAELPGGERLSTK